MAMDKAVVSTTSDPTHRHYNLLLPVMTTSFPKDTLSNALSNALSRPQASTISSSSPN